MVRQLAEKPPIKPLQILACARRPPSSDDIKASPDAKVEWHKVDIGDESSIASFAKTVKQSYPDGIDVLINNAGVNVDPTEGHGVKQATTTVDVNYRGTINMTKAFIPLMRKPGLQQLGHSRIVQVSSVGGKLQSWTSDKKMAQAFKSASGFGEVDGLRDAYIASVESGTESQGGWPTGKSYCVSKSLINAGTEILARENKDLQLNFCCPGWVQTDMGSLIGKPAKTLEEGTRVPLNVAFGPIKETGKYFENPSVSGKGPGQVSEW